MKVATWTGAAGTNEWDRAENWYEKIVPSNGDSIRIAAMKERPAPAVPADFLATDFYVAGSMAGLRTKSFLLFTGLV